MKRNRLTGLLLVLVMLVSMLSPASIYADETAPENTVIIENMDGEGTADAEEVPAEPEAPAEPEPESVELHIPMQHRIVQFGKSCLRLRVRHAGVRFF